MSQDNQTMKCIMKRWIITLSILALAAGFNETKADWGGYPMRSINSQWLFLSSATQINHAVTINRGDEAPLHVYAGMPGFMGGVPPEGVWRSLDGGDNWSPVWGTLLNNLDNLEMMTLAVDPNNSDRVFAGCSAFGINGDVAYRTTDGGADWYEVNPNPTEHINWVSAIYFHPTEANTIFLVAGMPVNQGHVAGIRDSGKNRQPGKDDP